ncbi:MAG: Unknown protein [uncultured Sulfurovum sp.]|uniref:DUF1266 domain-containing protein n=1 Tax=uncultured Sulfurovum sp. TaxID=269237 RepID=A0A6S6TPY4_9BACT|nr:MAG: Unknown protein [uncultured Sulfurovum sp.]
MNQEEIFALAFAKFEEERLLNSLEDFNVEAYLNDEFYFNINEDNASTKVYHVIKKVWTEGVLDLFIKNHILVDKLEVKDLVALDSTRFVKLVCEVLKLKLLEEKEAWGLLFLNAQRIQDTFENAEDFKASYFKGALFYEILFRSEEEERGEKIESFDALLQERHKASSVELAWLEDDVFDSFKIEGKLPNSPSKKLVKTPEKPMEAQVSNMHQLLEKEDKTALWKLLDEFSEEERNKFLHQLYTNKKHNSSILTAEDYLELPALYPDVSYAYYLRGVYFYHFAWEARGLGITNTVGQKNYALFYERLRYAMADLKQAHELSPNEQTYWAELYNLVKHFKSKEADLLQEKLYTLIKENAMQNLYCIQRVSHLNKARWGGSHKESLDWAREVITHNQKGSPIKIIIFEALIEQYNYILKFDRDEEKANAIFKELALQDEVNQYFDELLACIEKADDNISTTLMFWYEKVGDAQRIETLTDLIQSF